MNSAGLVYGTITVAALLAAESARQETYPETVGGVAIAIVLYWMVHSYATFTGDRLEHGEGFTARGLLSHSLHGLAVLAGAAVPFLSLIVCWAFGASLETGVLIAVWVAAAMVLVTELVIGIRADLTGRELALSTLVSAIIGVGIIGLRVLLH